MFLSREFNAWNFNYRSDLNWYFSLVDYLCLIICSRGILLQIFIYPKFCLKKFLKVLFYSINVAHGLEVAFLLNFQVLLIILATSYFALPNLLKIWVLILLNIETH